MFTVKKSENEKPVTIESFKEKWQVHITVKMRGKMSGMYSLSTSVLENDICRRRAKVKGSICEKCFSKRMSEAYGKDPEKDTYNKPFIKNTEVLTSVIIPVNEWPVINALYFRLEAFADLNNETQVINYFNFARRNPKTIFALWTKNPVFIKRVLDAGYKKPRNLIVIQSSCFINKQDAIVYDFIDKEFTVYDKKYINENNVEINCGARHCLSCARCYTKKKELEQIREKLK